MGEKGSFCNDSDLIIEEGNEFGHNTVIVESDTLPWESFKIIYCLEQGPASLDLGSVKVTHDLDIPFE